MTKQKAIIIDLEGTLSDHTHRVYHYYNKDYDKYNGLFLKDPVNEKFVSDLINCTSNLDIKIILCTAKEHHHERDVILWLVNNEIDFIYEFRFRNTGDKRSSVEVKKDMLHELVRKYDIIHAYDDRTDICAMYRKNGIPYTQVNCGKEKHKQTVSDILKNSARIFEERDAIYGSSYKQFGSIVDALFPDGIELNTVEDFNRWGVFHMMLSKVNRYANNFKSGGHKDSLDDLITYSAMLQELDNEL